MVIQGTVPKWWERSGFTFSPDASASADAGCCLTCWIPLEKEVFHTGQTTRLPGEGSWQAGSRIGTERGLKTSAPLRKLIRGKRRLFPLLVNKRMMKLLSQGHTEAKYRHGIMCKAWNNCITEKGHQPSNTFKAEKCIFWSCPGRLMQWCKIMRVCRTAMKIQFKIQFTSLPHFSFVKKENKTQTTLQLRYASKGESHWCDWYWHRYNHLKESRS